MGDPGKPGFLLDISKFTWDICKLKIITQTKKHATKNMKNELQNVDRIYIKEIGPLINRKSPDTIKRWCKESNVHVHKDCSGEFVYRNDFELAYDMPLILRLKKIHGENWRKVYDAYLKNELPNLLAFKEDLNKYKSGYKPKGNIGKKLV